MVNGQFALTVTEQDRLDVLEEVIEDGLQTFVDVGQALLEIRDGRLYRADYGTFENYCRDRWGFVQQHATRLIRASEAMINLKSEPIGSLPVVESQVRPLTRLEPEQQREAWQEAVKTASNGKMTAAHVAEVVERHTVPKPEKHAVHFSSETPEHYTPQEIIDAVIHCIGAIHLDPCSNPGEPNVPAGRHYTAAEDGLSLPWFGRVYMNPPYGREIDAWVTKLIEEHTAGNVPEAIALVPARTDTQWWMKLRDYPACFVEGRLKFGNSENSAPFPSAIFYLGNHIDHFYYSFCLLGDIWQRIEPGMFGE